MRGLWALRGFATKYWRVIVLSLLVMTAAGGVNTLAVNKFEPVFEPLFQTLIGASPQQQTEQMHKLLHQVLILLAWLVAAAILQGWPII